MSSASVKMYKLPLYMAYADSIVSTAVMAQQAPQRLCCEHLSQPINIWRIGLSVVRWFHSSTDTIAILSDEQLQPTRDIKPRASSTIQRTEPQPTIHVLFLHHFLVFGLHRRLPRYGVDWSVLEIQHGRNSGLSGSAKGVMYLISARPLQPVT